MNSREHKHLLANIQQLRLAAEVYEKYALRVQAQQAQGRADLLAREAIEELLAQALAEAKKNVTCR